MEICGCEILERLRDGARSTAYRARRLSDGLPLVLKVLKEQHPSQAQIASLRHEHAILDDLRDVDGIIRSYGVAEDGGRHALLLEDFGGSSLRALNVAGHLSVERILTLAIDVTSVLEAIHGRRIVHRDLNPSNIVMSPADGRVKVIDFGLASALPQEAAAFTSPGGLKGTLAYMSPEQTGRMNRPVDYRTDYYSFGVSLYELLTGRLPFAADDVLELVHAHIARQPTSPRAVNAAVPEVVADIVLKLMAKSADDRYQSARGIRADLTGCLEQLRQRGTVAAFPLARHDRSERFQLPQKLYGRDAEVERLTAAFERANQGAVLMLVSGYAGVGKSALIHEVYRPLTARRGSFISGKFDQYHSDAPYAALAQAFHALVEQVLTESEERLAAFRARALQALGERARVLVDVCPSLELVLGSQPNVAILPPTEARQRFSQAVRDFIAAVATPDHPLCIFFDDLQWANLDALKLLEELLATAQDLPLFVIGSYRDNEVTDGHPVALTVRAIEAQGTRVERLSLAPLGPEDVTAMVADALDAAPADAAPLADLLLSRTAGNPFFVRAFLTSLYADGLIERGADGFRWDLDRIRQRGITDNVVELMVGRLRQLPPVTQELLKVAGCLGGAFDLGTLAIVAERPVEEVGRDLWSAAAEGLLIPIDPVSSAVEMAAGGPGIRCRFAHDRIQQAVISMLDADVGPRLYRDVGRRLLRSATAEEQERRLFDVVGLLNQGRAAIKEPGELAELERLNLQAARRALEAGAGQQALIYARAGIALLGERAWSDAYELARDLHLVAAEAAFSHGDFEAMQGLCDAVRPKIRGVLDEVELLRIEGQAHYSQHRLAEAVRTYIEALRRLDVEVPESPAPEDIALELREAAAALDGRPIEELVDLPECGDPIDRARMAILNQVINIAGIAGMSLFPVVIGRLVRMSLRSGLVPQSSSGFTFYALLLLRSGEVEAAHHVARLALRLADRMGNKEIRAQTYLYGGFHAVHVKVPLQALSPMFLDAYRSALEAGHPFHAAAGAETFCVVRFLAGDDLAMLASDMEQYAHAIAKLRQEMVLGWHQIYLQTVLNLRGKATDQVVLAGPAYVEAERLPAQRTASDVGALFSYHFCKTLLCYLFGEHEQAASIAEATTPYLVVAETCASAAPWALLESLAHLAVHDHADEAARERTLALVERNIAKLETWREHCPATYEHKLLLIRAERARVLGQDDAARDAFERGAELAEKSGYQHEAAIAHELAGRFYLARGDQKLARQHLRDAHEGYLRWGAVAKAKALEKQHPGLVPHVASGILAASKFSETAGRELDFSVLDLISVLNASQDLSREIELDRLLARLMQILLETSGAEVGYLLLEQGGQWVVEGEKAVDEDAKVLRSIPMADLAPRGRRGLPTSIVYYVARTQESVVLDDAAANPRFGRDPHIAENAVGSVLCFPLGRPGGRRGIVYLENSLVKGAFTPARMRILQMLSTQAVISLENAALYNTLEQRVQARTRELQAKNEELAATLKRLREAQDRMIVQDRLASLGSLTAGIAHELRNPLNFVNNFADLSVRLIDDIGGDISTLARGLDDDRGEYVTEALGDLTSNVKKIGEHGRRMEGIIRSMLDHSRGERGERQSVDFNTLVSTYVSIGYHGARARASSAEIAIDLDLSPSIGQVSLVPQEISRVVVNLVDNACYAVRRRSEAQGHQPSPRIRVTTRDLGDRVELRVHDNGVGIPAGIRDKIMNPFFTTKPPGEGTGLGLSICHNIVVEGNGGSLTFETQEGEFTEFIVTLPKHLSGPEPGAA
ncbi:trifunctional serine/threonine-protein kinase/ATP-binding protein/sensor histidine kinase [Sorangium sp. So ce1024]|uniref:trifunctional serine/threonine-protein kinase/ATP-binding protein/sensor histidine kinase n=1 Tax=Sorangium sp. So ce1024 TaxID=3133327 RepID=UPI003F061107